MTVKTTTGVSSIGRVLPGVLDGGPNHMAKVADGRRARDLPRTVYNGLGE